MHFEQPHTSIHHTVQPEAAVEGFLAIICHIAGHAFGLPVAAVREVVSLPALLGLAGAPPYLRGLLNLRGEFLPVLDGRTLIGSDAPLQVTSQIVILGGANPQFGLIVDQAQAVRSVTVARTTASARFTALPIIADVIDDGAGAALLLDVVALHALLPAPTTAA
jgi:purine-binding chemotaxis protein CheW